MSKTIVIVGGVAGGATTAARLRRVDETAKIIMIERGENISYANCGLPYYIGGVIKERSSLLIQTPRSFGQLFNIDVRIFTEVVDIDPDKKTVAVKNLKDDTEYSLYYDQLVLSPGAKPIIPPLPGIDHKNIFTLRNVDDTDNIKAFVDNEEPKSAVVIGAGFIGLEMAENLHHLGVDVDVVEAAPQVLNMLDPEMSALLHQHFKEQNVGLHLNSRVMSFEDLEGDRIKITLENGTSIETDFVILSIGVKPDVMLAKKAGLKIGETGAIWVDPYLQTSKKDIYALGDCIEYPHPVSGTPVITYLAGPANKQGRLLANNLTFGHRREYSGSHGTAIAKIFDLTAAITGASDKALDKAGVEYISTIINGGSHAGYYPGALQMTMKINFHPETGLVYGGQIVGYKGVDKRIDMLATTIQNRGTIFDLQEVEHAYAPPFNSAKEMVNQIGFNAQNIMEGFFKPLTTEMIVNRDKEDTILLDVRTAEEVSLGTIEGAINISVNDIRDCLSRLDKSKAIYLFCGVGMRGYIAARVLAQNGFDRVYNLSGGLKVYRAVVAEQSNTLEVSTPIPVDSSGDGIIYDTKVIEVDACGLQCPGPIMRLKEEVDNLDYDSRLEIKASDAGFYNDVASWCNVTGNELVSRSKKDGVITALIEKKNKSKEGFTQTQSGDNKTMVVFSDDMDKALASFVIANGAASMGKKVTMFFTFWGLNVIKAPKKPSVKKDFMGKMFSMMMPAHSKKLSLSKMNMGGMGTKMMRQRMKQRNVDSLEIMIQKAKLAGVEMIACQMSMDIMGVDKDELMKGVTIGGVANYLEEAEHANVNLFI